MDKPRRTLDPLEMQEEDQANFKAGYEAFLNGGPPDVKNTSAGWLDGWKQAEADLAKNPTKIHN